jgi:lysozyme family protein
VAFKVNEFRTVDFIGIAGVSSGHWLLNAGFKHRSVSDEGILRRDNQSFFTNAAVSILDTKAEVEVVATQTDRPLWQAGIAQEVFPSLFFGFAVEVGDFAPVRRLSVSYSLPIKS